MITILAYDADNGTARYISVSDAITDTIALHAQQDGISVEDAIDKFLDMSKIKKSEYASVKSELAKFIKYYLTIGTMDEQECNNLEEVAYRLAILRRDVCLRCRLNGEDRCFYGKPCSVYSAINMAINLVSPEHAFQETVKPNALEETCCGRG